MADNNLQQDPLSRLYSNIKNSYDLPDFSTFKADMSDSNKAKKLHETLVKDGYDMPAFDVFSTDMGLKKKDLGGPISSPTELPLQGFSQKQIDLLQKGVEKPIESVYQKKSSGLVVPSNLPKQEARAYENELKLNNAAVNTLTDIYKNKGLKFDPTKPAAKKQIQEYIDKVNNDDLSKVTGRDGKDYLVRSQGFFESAANSLVKSIKQPIESTEINFTDSPEKLADLLDKKIKEEPNVPKEAPSQFSGYLGELVGGVPKLAALTAIPYIGESAMVGEVYYNALANQRRALYERGLQEGMDRVTAAKKAMDAAPVSAIPDALVAAVMAKGVGGSGASVLPNAAKQSFIKAAGSSLKGVARVSATGGFSEYERSKILQRAGYDVKDSEAIENLFKGAGDYAIMDAAFKLIHAAPKAVTSAAKNLLSNVHPEILKVVAKNYPDGEKTLEEIPKFVETKSKVEGYVPEEKVSSVTGLTEKSDNIKKDIADLEEKKKNVPSSIAAEIDNQIKEKNKEVQFYDNQIKKVIESKDETGISEEVDDLTGLKIGKEFVPKEVKIGDEIQWTSQGADQFVEPKKIKSISENGEYAFVEGSDTGIPINEISVTKAAPVEVKVTEEVKPTEAKPIEEKPIEQKLKKGEKYVYHHTGDKKISNITEGSAWFTSNKFGAPTRARGVNKVIKIINPSDFNLASNKEFMSLANISLNEAKKVLQERGYEGVKRTIDGDSHYWIFDVSKLRDVNVENKAEKAKPAEVEKKEVKIREEKAFAQKDLDRAEAKRIHGRVAEMEPPSDADQIALRYLADGGKVSQDAINEVSGTTKGPSLNTGRRELKTAEVKARDYAEGNESLNDLAHRLWELNGQKISERDIKNSLMSEIGSQNTRLDASKSYLERYSPEYQAEQYYNRLAEERQEEFLKEQEELERQLREPLDEQIEGEASEEHINNLIKQYEAEFKRENQQFEPESKGEVIKEIGSRGVREEAPKEKIEEEAYKDLTRNEKRRIINSKFEELLTNEDFYKKFKIKSKCL